MRPEVYWIRDIEPLRIAMMPRPRGGEWLTDEVSGWKQMGIDAVVSLLHRYEVDELELSEEERMCISHGIRYQSFPIEDRGTPEAERPVIELASELAASVKQGSAVAVHCRAGIGRSGLLAGAVLLHHITSSRSERTVRCLTSIRCLGGKGATYPETIFLEHISSKRSRKRWMCG